MEVAAWKQLFEGFRPEDQECLVVSVAGGLDIAVQSVARVEDEVVLLRGRVSGQAEVGRVFVIPYDRLNSIYVNRYVQAEETELFSPSVSVQRKDQIAKMVQQMKEKAREEAQASEMTRNTGSVHQDIRKQLEELREKQANMQQQLPAPAKSAPEKRVPEKAVPSKPALPASTENRNASSPTVTRTTLPGRFTLNKKPGDD